MPIENVSDLARLLLILKKRGGMELNFRALQVDFFEESLSRKSFPCNLYESVNALLYNLSNGCLKNEIAEIVSNQLKKRDSYTSKEIKISIKNIYFNYQQH